MLMRCIIMLESYENLLIEVLEMSNEMTTRKLDCGSAGRLYD